MIVPKLRFSEFKDEWLDYSINDFAETVTSGSRDWAKYYSKSGDKFIRMTNLIRNGIYLNLDDLKFVNLPIDSNEGKRTSLQHGDILVSITAELGKIGWIPNDLGTAYINQHTALIRTNDKIDSKFLAYLLSTEKYNNQINGLNDSGAKAGLNLSTLRNFKFIVSQNKKEQTKIAEFLSAVDDKINQLSRQLELLNQYKKGVMQKIFSQEIRFKNDNGEDFGEWEEKTIKDICDVKGGKRLPKGYSLVENNTGFPYITVSDMNNGSVSLEKIRYIPENAVNQIKNYRITTKDIFISVAGTLGLIGIIPKELENANLTENADKLTNIQCNQKYLYYFLKNGSLDRLIDNVSTVGAQPKLALYAIQEMEIQIPTIQEQEKIAEFLTAIDERIDHTTAQLTHTKQWKKGLLQQMFV